MRKFHTAKCNTSSRIRGLFLCSLCPDTDDRCMTRTRIDLVASPSSESGTWPRAPHADLPGGPMRFAGGHRQPCPWVYQRCQPPPFSFYATTSMSVSLPIGRTSKPRPSGCKRTNVLERLFLHPAHTLEHLRAHVNGLYQQCKLYGRRGMCTYE